MNPGIRLFFECFSTNYFNSEQRKHRMRGITLKNKLISECLAQLSGKYRPIHFSDCPIIVDFTFMSAHRYDNDNYFTMAKYIQDCLVFRGILQDDNTKIVNETRIRVMPISQKFREGCFIRFIPNKTPDFPKINI